MPVAVRPSVYNIGTSSVGLHADTNTATMWVRNNFIGIQEGSGGITWYPQDWTNGRDFNNLKPNTLYNFYSKYQMAESFDKPYITYTQSPPAAIYTFGPPRAVEVTHGSVGATWIDVSQNVTEPVHPKSAKSDTYQYQWWKSSTPGDIYTSNAYTRPPMRITNLAAGTTYIIRGRANNMYGWSPWSANHTVLTLSGVPSAPTNVRATKVTATSVEITLTPGTSADEAASPVNAYEATYWYASDPSKTFVSDISRTLPFTISNLKPNEDVVIKVRNMNRWAWSGYSGNLTIDLPSGFWVNVGGTWKRAVPYVNINGVWKPVYTRVNDYGIWKEGML